jgi:hypothetical protein
MAPVNDAIQDGTTAPSRHAALGRGTYMVRLDAEHRIAGGDFGDFTYNRTELHRAAPLLGRQSASCAP